EEGEPAEPQSPTTEARPGIVSGHAEDSSPSSAALVAVVVVVAHRAVEDVADRERACDRYQAAEENRLPCLFGQRQLNPWPEHASSGRPSARGSASGARSSCGRGGGRGGGAGGAWWRPA